MVSSSTFYLLFFCFSLFGSSNVSGWAPPRLTSPTYSRDYTYWKKGSGVDECKTYTFSQAFQENGVQRPPLKVPPFVWKWAYYFQLKALPLLHAFDDTSQKIPNSSLALPILWWKALMRNTNPTAAAWAYDLLPKSTRWIVKVFSRFFPPLHHVNIQLRTTFLDDRTKSIVKKVRSESKNRKHIRLVVVGAGYDLRSLRFLQDGIIDEAIEMDLANVMEAKKSLLKSSVFQLRRPKCQLPKMISVDLNCIETANTSLQKILTKDQDTYTVFLLEGILVHLDAGFSSKVLKLLRSFCNAQGDGSLIFCDRIQGVNNRSLELARSVLAETGWTLNEFLATPTKTPHFGVAEMKE
jgi:O-methyltransferase involved in polyketide biosynthesis